MKTETSEQQELLNKQIPTPVDNKQVLDTSHLPEAWQRFYEEIKKAVSTE